MARPWREARTLLPPPLLHVLVPGPALPLDQRDRRGRAPASGRIWTRMVRTAGPGFQDRLDPAPGGLDLVAAHEQGRIAAHRVHQQALIGVGETPTEGLLEAD